MTNRPNEQTSYDQ